MSVHDLAAGIHQILDSACHSHLLCSRLLCFNYGIINFVVTLDLDKLIGAIRHLRKEVRIILADSAGLRVVVVDREIALVGGEHTCEVHFRNLDARDVLHKAFLLRDGIEAVSISMETLLKLLRREARIAVCKNQVILCREFVVACVFRLAQQYQFPVLSFQFRSDIKQRMEYGGNDIALILVSILLMLGYGNVAFFDLSFKWALIFSVIGITGVIMTFLPDKK